MGSLSDFSENELLDHVFNAAYTAPTTIYLALCTADPTDAGTGASMNEAANANAYARTAITFGAAASRRVTQNADVTFPQASGAWGTVTHWAITDNATYGAGNMLAHGAFGTSKSIVSGNTPKVVSGEVYVEISAGEVSDYLANNWLDLMFRNQTFTKPATYIALVDTIVTDADTGTTISEPAGGSYARVQVNVNGGVSPTWDLAVAGALDNTHEILFPTATASWGTIVGVSIVDAATVGNALFYDNDMADQAVGIDDVVSFAAGALDVSLS